MKISILGSDWTIEYHNAENDLILEGRDGYTDHSVNLIVYPVMQSIVIIDWCSLFPHEVVFLATPRIFTISPIRRTWI